MQTRRAGGTRPDRVSHLILIAGQPKFSSSDDDPYGASEEQIRKGAAAYGTGHETPAMTERILATVLFTDIVESTYRPRVWVTPRGDRRSMNMTASLDVASSSAEAD